MIKNKIFAFGVAVLAFAADYSSKVWALHALSTHKITVNAYMNFALAFNKGAAFSFLADRGGWQRWFFTGIALVVGGWLIYAIARQNLSTIVRLSYGLILGGALGNLYDRIARGHVVDFIQWHIGQHAWPTFNLADVAITIGVGLLIIDALWEGLYGRDSSV